MTEQRRIVRRIHILGAAGSGKTTLARQLAAVTGAPCYDLDEIGYEGGFGRKRSLDVRLADLARITAQPAWITEGIFLWWTQTLFAQADAIIWLDLPWPISMSRIFTRHIRLSWAGTNRHPGILKLARFIWYCRRYYLERQPRAPAAQDDDGALNRVTVAHYLAPYQEKVLRCQSPKEVRNVVAWIEEL